MPLLGSPAILFSTAVCSRGGGHVRCGIRSYRRKPDAAANCQSQGKYRARNPFKNPLNRLVLDNLAEFEAWRKDAPAGKPRPHRSVITAFEKFSECGVLRYGAALPAAPNAGMTSLWLSPASAGACARVATPSALP
jgi:hypothetical protein